MYDYKFKIFNKMNSDYLNDPVSVMEDLIPIYHDCESKLPV